MNANTTKQNYETANDWHIRKSLSHSWAPDIKRFMQLIPTASPRILDVGCGGSGRDIQEFLDTGAVVEGLDYSHAAIESVRKIFPSLVFHEADMTKSGLPSARYDGVWACASILNLEKTQVPAAFAEFDRLLVPGGALFVSVKEGEGEHMVPDQAGERFFSFFAEDELTALAENSGFTVTELRTETHAPRAETGTVAGTRWILLFAQKS